MHKIFDTLQPYDIFVIFTFTYTTSQGFMALTQFKGHMVY